MCWLSIYYQIWYASVAELYGIGVFADWIGFSGPCFLVANALRWEGNYFNFTKFSLDFLLDLKA